MAQYFVGPGGNDASAGTSWALRKLTIQASATVVGTISKAAVVEFISDGTAWFEVSRALVL